MFSAKRLFSKLVPLSPARVDRRSASLPEASLLVAALSVGTASCALEVHEGDGLASDGIEVQINPSVNSGTKPGATDKGFLECKHLDLFTQTVMPVLTTPFQGKRLGLPDEVLEPQSCVSCHEVKPKALLEMYMDVNKVKDTCQVAYLRQRLHGDILASSDPGMPQFEHEFKFQNVEDYNRFRDAMSAWINAEGIVTMPKAPTH